MDSPLDKSISFLLFLFIGFLLKKKISPGDETNGLKSLILSIALPATIFIALLKIDISSQLILFPFLALTFNCILFLVTPFLLFLIGIDKNSARGRSARLLISSLAPGLSCFPFVLEFLGDNSLAKAAMSDLGNKFFVLFVLYLIALKWYYKNIPFQSNSLNVRLKSLFKIFVCEPVNLLIIAALILVFFGIRLDTIPHYLSITLTRLSYMMTPLVLIFIGLAVKIKKIQFLELFSLLLLRAGFTILVIVAFIYFGGIVDKKDILVMITFSLSACSFWPYAHISSVNFIEKKENKTDKTFDPDFSLFILALSLPISVLLILGILTAGNTFVKIDNLLILGILLFSVGLLYPIIMKINSFFKNKIEFFYEK